MMRIEFFFNAPDLAADQTGARPKTMYLAGDRFARIEQFADINSDLKHLIIVDEPNIWLVDAKRKTVGHSVNHGSDQKVHNPILGPEVAEELLSLEYGHELEFFENQNARHLSQEIINGVKCDVRELSSADYRLTLYVDARHRTPILLRALNTGTLLFEIHYTSYEKALPFRRSVFQPPEDLTLVEADTE